MELRLNVPPRPPGLQATIGAALSAVAARTDFGDRLIYGSTAGRGEDREAAARWLQPRLGEVMAEDVVISAGGASLLVALVTTLTSPADAIVTEDLTYPGIRAVSRHFGMSLVGVATDKEGLIPAALAETCTRLKPRLLYCTPTIQNPTTSTMSTQRRAEIAQVARNFDLMILEDDAYGMLPADGPPPLAHFAPERTFYMASLAKCLSPSLRIAYCAGPRARLAEMTEGVRVVSYLASPLTAAIATQLLEDGGAAAILDGIRTETVERQAIAREALTGMDLAADPYGPHLWLELPGEWNVPELGAHLRERGVPAKGDGFAVDGVNPNALRLALGAPASREELSSSLGVLKATLDEGKLRIS